VTGASARGTTNAPLRGNATPVHACHSAGADVDAHPRVERQPVGAPPGGVALDGDERVALLATRADRRDEVAEPARRAEVEHGAQEDLREAAALRARADLGGKRAGRVRRGGQRERARERRVDAGREAVGRGVPAARDHVALGDRLVVAASEDELEVREAGGQLRPGRGEHVAVAVVLGPDLGRDRGRARVEVGALGGGVDGKAGGCCDHGRRGR
jgi:hypothetical protein